MAKYTLSDIFKGKYRVSQVFGANPAYYKRISGGRLAGHEGVDWATPTGTQLLCPFESGIIIRTGWNAAYGYYVVIWDQKQRCAVWHCHMSRIYVTPGQRVARNAVVGLSGNTGNSTGPHLHENLVETDAYGNRLNSNNGYMGYRNILSSTLVFWKIRLLSRLGSKKYKPQTVKNDIKEGTLTVDEVIEKDLTEQEEVFKK